MMRSASPLSAFVDRVEITDRMVAVSSTNGLVGDRASLATLDMGSFVSDLGAAGMSGMLSPAGSPLGSPAGIRGISGLKVSPSNFDEIVGDLVAHAQECVAAAKDLQEEHEGKHEELGEEKKGGTSLSHNLLVRNARAAAELEALVSRLSHVVHTSRPGERTFVSLESTTRAAQACLDEEHGGLLREVGQLEQSNRRHGQTTRGVELHKERQEHLAKRCRTLQGKCDVTAQQLRKARACAVSHVNGNVELGRAVKLLRTEMRVVKEQRQGLEERLKNQLHVHASVLRDAEATFAAQASDLHRNLDAAREGLHRAKLRVEDLQARLGMTEAALGAKSSSLEDVAKQMGRGQAEMRKLLDAAAKKTLALVEDKKDLCATLEREMDTAEAKRNEMEKQVRDAHTRATECAAEAREVRVLFGKQQREAADLVAKHKAAEADAGSKASKLAACLTQNQCLEAENTQLKASLSGQDRDAERANAALKLDLEEEVEGIRVKVALLDSRSVAKLHYLERIVAEQAQTIHQLTVKEIL